MKKETLAQALGEVDARYVHEAETFHPARRAAWRRWGALAAGVCLVLGLAAAALLRAPATPRADTDTEAADGPPHFVLDGQAYVISPHLSVAETLPDGFTEAGTLDVVGGYADCPYYTSPDKPQWVYVYHEVRTDGTVDETGTLRATEPHGAYARYVDVRLRGKDLLCYNGVYYISLWTATTSGDAPDISQTDYDAVYARYGLRIEGDAPEGFVSLGTATFTGDDTVPTGELASNVAAAEVCCDPSQPDILLYRTQWYTATAEDGGERRHTGWNVYLRYPCPLAE